MSFPGIIRRLFANNGAGPKLRKDILPSHADTHAPGGSDPLDLETLGGVSSDDFSALQEKVAGLIEAIGNIDPWTIFPPRLPVAIDGVTFGGSDGRRAIMPGETEAREDWILCDGGSDGKGGTVPDLRGRMILGASDEHTAGSTGGSETHSHSISGTVGETTLTEAQLASHKHYVSRNKDLNDANENEGSTGYHDTVGNYSSSSWNYTTSSTGSSGTHTHPLSGAKSGSASNLPPYFAMPFVTRIA
jgi:microcystin-dependent protein